MDLHDAIRRSKTKCRFLGHRGPACKKTEMTESLSQLKRYTRVKEAPHTYRSHSIRPRRIQPPPQALDKDIQRGLELQQGETFPETCPLAPMEGDKLRPGPSPSVLLLDVLAVETPSLWPKLIRVRPPRFRVAVCGITVVSHVCPCRDEYLASEPHGLRNLAVD